jgi:osmotically-inducible protein OsmY
MAQAFSQKTDSEIQEEVLKELNWDTRVRAADVGVEVDEGVVTLTGTVDSWAKKLAAQEAAHRVIGVLDVANDMQVKARGTGDRTDTEIAQAVRRSLEWDVFVPETRIQSTVSNGIVTLEGSVDFWSQREDAERAVRNLLGVSGVNNRIEVSSTKVSQEITDAIEDALARHAQREAKRIGVVVHEGKVTLNGSVQSWAEKEAVLGAARGTVGVREIQDRLRIEA